MLKNPAFLPSIAHSATDDAWLDPVMRSARANGFAFSDEEFINAAAVHGINDFLALLRSTAEAASPQQKKVTHLWKTTGAYFGYIDGDNLWSKAGKHVGKIVNDEVYDFQGHYIGELWGKDYLIADKRKKRLNRRVGHSYPVLPSRAAISTLGSRPSTTIKHDYEEFTI